MENTPKAASYIKVFLSDVDGVMTDAGMYYTESGEELKRFNTHDGMGLKLLQLTGVKTGLITTETSQIVQHRANKLKLDYAYLGRGFAGKLSAAIEICEKENITLKEVAYIGDDVNCIELLSSVGLAACPDNALPKVKAIPGIIHLAKKGGDGAVREFIDMIMDGIC